MIKVILVCLLAYLAGSVNFAVLFFKLVGRDDPRSRFSGNAGTTNVYRQAGMLWAVLILALDIGRALAVAAAARHYITTDGGWLIWAGFFLILGNSFPCFYGFRGGKGVASYLGFTALIVPGAALLAAIVWVLVYAVKRVPFVASFFMVGVLSVGHSLSFHWAPPATAAAGATFALIIFNHRMNIRQCRKDRRLSAQEQ
ncbi:MAG: glycerol-3-phosphate acyltransferase [Smithella sp.]|jgi:glycerol-3-phosphate acyltransferase PlsY